MKTISMAEKVTAKLEGRGPAPSTPAEGGANPEPAVPTTDSPSAGDPATPPPEGNFLELDMGGERQRVNLDELTGTEEGRARLRDLLSKERSFEDRKRQLDAEADERARRIALKRDLDRGLLTVNPATGAIEETDLGRQFRMGRQPSQQQEQPPAGEYLTAEEQARVNELREEGMSGDPDKFAEADRIVHAAIQRNAMLSVDNRVKQHLEAQNAMRAQAQAQQDVQRIVSTVESEIAKFPVFTSDSRFAQMAKDAVAGHIERNGGKFDQVALHQVALLAQRLGAPAPAAEPAPQPKTPPRRQAPPAGPGSTTPPGPPLNGNQQASSTPQGEPSRPRLGTDAMVRSVADRLRGR